MTRLIDADKLRQYIDDCEYCEKCDTKSSRCYVGCELPDCVTPQWERVLNEQQTVDAEPVRHGRWIYLDKDNKFFKKHIVECSLCNNSLDLHAVNGGRGDANYCPNCGAKMGDDHGTDLQR